VRWQENNSFANFGFVSAGAVCKCVVLSVGCSLNRLYFLSFAAKLPLSLVFSSLVPNGWRYKIVAHFEAQTYQPAKPLIKCYFVQI
jgi:hypothetical protein